MKHHIHEVLGQNYCMFFHPGLPINRFTPGQSLAQCVEISNHLIDLYGRDFTQWDPCHHDTVARIMNANWICQQLSVEPIRKPLLVHCAQDQLIVDCGDTRVMALSALENPPDLSAVITVRIDQAYQYTDWIPVQNNQDLIRLCNFDTGSASLLLTPADPGLDWCITWFEIGDLSTSHHLHNVASRVDMLQNWLNTQSNDFKFSAEWITETIDWAMFQAN